MRTGSNSYQGWATNSGFNLESLVVNLFSRYVGIMPMTEKAFGWNAEELKSMFQTALPGRYKSITAQAHSKELATVKGVLDHLYKVDCLIQVGQKTIGLQITSDLRKIDYKLSQLREVRYVSETAFIAGTHLIYFTNTNNWEGVALAPKETMLVLLKEVERIVLLLEKKDYSEPQLFELSLG